jgi:hypothetical protein
MNVPTPTDAAAFDRATDPVFRILDQDQARKIVDFCGDEALQRRIEEHAEMANEGKWTSEEAAEYRGYAQANQFIAVLQAKAHQLLPS